MVETYRQKFMKHYRAKGLFYSIYRAKKYIQWRRWCRRHGVDWRQFSKEENKVK